MDGADGEAATVGSLLSDKAIVLELKKKSNDILYFSYYKQMTWKNQNHRMNSTNKYCLCSLIQYILFICVTDLTTKNY